MNENFAAQEAHGTAGEAGGKLCGADLSQAGLGLGSNRALQPDAQAQGTAALSTASEVMLPCLQEMGDIAPAISILLRMQADYARGMPGVSRAMRDVACNAVATEIERYIRGVLRRSSTTAERT